MYKVELDIYSGPLDLLYFLIEKNEISVDSIEIAKIADQFIDYIKKNVSGKMDNISSFLVMASKLMHMKSLMLLPRKSKEDLEELENLKDELHSQMEQYILFKNLSSYFENCKESYNNIFERKRSEDFFKKEIELHINDIDVNILNKVFIQLMNKQEKLKQPYTHKINREIITINECMIKITERLEVSKSFVFNDVIKQYIYKEEVINFFLAILELSKIHIIRLVQGQSEEDIFIEAV